MNSAGDVLFKADTLEGPEDDPEWTYKSILWTRQPSVANPNGTLAIIDHPGEALNAHGLMVKLKSKHPINPATGEEDLSQPAYTAAVLMIPMQMVALDSDGLPTDEPFTAEPSYPSPIVNVTSLSVTDVAVGADGQLRGTIHAVGTVTSALCDTGPGADGEIEELGLYVNGGTSRTTAIVTASKGSSGTFGRPYPYDGAFDATLADIVLAEGENVLMFDAEAIFCHRPRLRNPDGVDDPSIEDKVRMAALYLPPDSQFQFGFTVGFAAGGADLACGLGHLTHLTIEQAVTQVTIYGLGVTVAMKNVVGMNASGQNFVRLGMIQNQRELAEKGIGTIRTLFWLAAQWKGEETALKIALLTGQVTDASTLHANMGELHRRMGLYSYEAIAALVKELADGTYYDRGRIFGRAAFEIAAILVTPEMLAGQLSKLQFIEKFLAAIPKFLDAGQVAHITAELAPVRAALESDAILVAARATNTAIPARETIVSLQLLVEADFVAQRGSRADRYMFYVRETLAKGEPHSGFEIAKGAQDIVVKDLADVAGTPNIDLKSYEWWKSNFPSMEGGQAGWEFHHLIENQIWNRLMELESGTVTAGIPAIPLKGYHRSVADIPYGPFHRNTENAVGLSEKIKDIMRLTTTDEQLLIELKSLYTEPPFGRLGKARHVARNKRLVEGKSASD